MDQFKQSIFNNAMLNEWNALKKAQDVQDKLEQDLAARKTKVESDYRRLNQEKEFFEQEKIEATKASKTTPATKRAKTQKLRDELAIKKSLIENRVPIDVKLHIANLAESDELVRKYANIDASLDDGDVFDESEFEKAQEAHQQEKQAFDAERKAFKSKQASTQKKSDDIDKEINAMKEKFDKIFQLRDQYFQDA